MQSAVEHTELKIALRSDGEAGEVSAVGGLSSVNSGSNTVSSCGESGLRYSSGRQPTERLAHWFVRTPTHATLSSGSGRAQVNSFWSDHSSGRSSARVSDLLAYAVLSAVDEEDGEDASEGTSPLSAAERSRSHSCNDEPEDEPLRSGDRTCMERRLQCGRWVSPFFNEKVFAGFATLQAMWLVFLVYGQYDRDSLSTFHAFMEHTADINGSQFYIALFASVASTIPSFLANFHYGLISWALMYHHFFDFHNRLSALNKTWLAFLGIMLLGGVFHFDLINKEVCFSQEWLRVLVTASVVITSMVRNFYAVICLCSKFFRGADHYTGNLALQGIVVYDQIFTSSGLYLKLFPIVHEVTGENTYRISYDLYKLRNPLKVVGGVLATASLLTPLLYCSSTTLVKVLHGVLFGVTAIASMYAFSQTFKDISILMKMAHDCKRLQLTALRTFIFFLVPTCLLLSFVAQDPLYMLLRLQGCFSSLGTLPEGLFLGVSQVVSASFVSCGLFSDIKRPIYNQIAHKLDEGSVPKGVNDERLRGRYLHAASDDDNTHYFPQGGGNSP